MSQTTNKLTEQHALLQQRQAFATDYAVTIMTETEIKKVTLSGYKILNKL